MAKITKLDDNLIEFSDGTCITCDHEQDCCEYNYADCQQLDDLARNYDFDTQKLVFEGVDEYGFRFGDRRERMFFIPCYSIQNGYYTCHLDVYLNGVIQTSLECEECDG